MSSLEDAWNAGHRHADQEAARRAAEAYAEQEWIDHGARAAMLEFVRILNSHNASPERLYNLASDYTRRRWVSTFHSTSIHGWMLYLGGGSERYGAVSTDGQFYSGLRPFEVFRDVKQSGVIRNPRPGVPARSGVDSDGNSWTFEQLLRSALHRISSKR